MAETIRVLLVEDEQRIRKILEYNLKLDGFQVYTAGDGPSGLETARKERPDLILLDWMMPGMDGLQVLSELKADETTENIPVFMLTAKSMMVEVGRALYEGADDYITKPFEPREFGQMLREKLAKVVEAKSG